jgi:hypothetical protein
MKISDEYAPTKYDVYSSNWVIPGLDTRQEPRYFWYYSDWATGRITEESVFDSRQRQGILCFILLPDILRPNQRVRWPPSPEYKATAGETNCLPSFCAEVMNT